MLEKVYKSVLYFELLWLVLASMSLPVAPDATQLSVIDMITFAYLPLLLTALYQLRNFKPSGRLLFVALFCMGIPMTLIAEPNEVPSSSLYELLLLIGGFLDGMVISLVYFSALRHRFAKESVGG
jgi:hypothetical protein